jgi:hypothetical protein
LLPLFGDDGRLSLVMTGIANAEHEPIVGPMSIGQHIKSCASNFKKKRSTPASRSG